MTTSTYREGNRPCGITLILARAPFGVESPLTFSPRPGPKLWPWPTSFFKRFFYRAPGRSGALELAGDLPGTEGKNLRVYVDDDFMATEADIVDVHEVAND